MPVWNKISPIKIKRGIAMKKIIHFIIIEFSYKTVNPWKPFVNTIATTLESPRETKTWIPSIKNINNNANAVPFCQAHFSAAEFINFWRSFGSNLNLSLLNAKTHV